MKQKNSQTGKWILIIIVLLSLIILAYIVAGIMSLFFSFGLGTEDVSMTSGTGNVALIPVKGLITTADIGFPYSKSVVTSNDIIEYIVDAEENPLIQAIILEIDSTGGTPVASEEVAAAVKNAEKLTVAWIREAGASGAYWVASSADKIVASRMSLIGSVGVYGSYLEFSGLMKKYGVDYQRFVGGQYKDVGTPFRKLSVEEEKLFQRKIDSLHDYFVNSVVDNRGLSEEQRASIATGEFFLGMEGEKLGLVDVIGSKQEALDIVEQELNITAEIVTYLKKRTLFDVLGQLAGQQSFFFGEGFANMLLEKQRTESIQLIT